MQSKVLQSKVVQGEILLSQDERGAKRNVPTPEPQTAIPVARALYNMEFNFITCEKLMP